LTALLAVSASSALNFAACARLLERVVRHHQVLSCVHQPAHSPIGPLREYLVACERLSHRFRVAALAQQRPAQFDPRNASVQVLGSLTLREAFYRLAVQRLGAGIL